MAKSLTMVILIVLLLQTQLVFAGMAREELEQKCRCSACFQFHHTATVENDPYCGSVGRYVQDIYAKDCCCRQTSFGGYNDRCECYTGYTGTPYTCDRCSAESTARCDSCAVNYAGYPNCRLCDTTVDCSGVGVPYSANNQCKCTCPNRTTGSSCDRCKISPFGIADDDLVCMNPHPQCSPCLPARFTRMKVDDSIVQWVFDSNGSSCGAVSVSQQLNGLYVWIGPGSAGCQVSLQMLVPDFLADSTWSFPTTILSGAVDGIIRVGLSSTVNTTFATVVDVDLMSANFSLFLRQRAQLLSMWNHLRPDLAGGQSILQTLPQTISFSACRVKGHFQSQRNEYGSSRSSPSGQSSSRRILRKT